MMPKLSKGTRSLERIRLLVVFAMLGSIMFISDILMEFLPNVHLVGVLTVVYTIVYRSKALIPIYVYVFINGLYMGFGIWWIAYLYVWAILWAFIMLVPRRLPKGIRTVLYIIAVTAHGLLFGILYMPVQYIYMPNIKMLWTWVSVGFVTADIYHGIGNLIFGGLLIMPLSRLLIELEAKTSLKK